MTHAEQRAPAPPPSVRVHLSDAEATTAIGERLASLLRAGDLLILTGDLGAGKTTLTQGLGRGLGVRGPITSPTFVISRVHPSLVGGPALVHVDAYRLGSAAEVDDLDLDDTLAEAVTVIEWGQGRAEHLAESHLSLVLEHRVSDEADARAVTVTGWGERWAHPEASAGLLALDQGASTPMEGER